MVVPSSGNDGQRGKHCIWWLLIALLGSFIISTGQRKSVHCWVLSSYHLNSSICTSKDYDFCPLSSNRNTVHFTQNFLLFTFIYLNYLFIFFLVQAQKITFMLLLASRVSPFGLKSRIFEVLTVLISSPVCSSQMQTCSFSQSVYAILSPVNIKQMFLCTIPTFLKQFKI